MKKKPKTFWTHIVLNCWWCCDAILWHSKGKKKQWVQLCNCWCWAFFFQLMVEGAPSSSSCFASDHFSVQRSLQRSSYRICLLQRSWCLHKNASHKTDVLPSAWGCARCLNANNRKECAGASLGMGFLDLRTTRMASPWFCSSACRGIHEDWTSWCAAEQAAAHGPLLVPEWAAAPLRCAEQLRFLCCPSVYSRLVLCLQQQGVHCAHPCKDALRSFASKSIPLLRVALEAHLSFAQCHQGECHSIPIVLLLILPVICYRCGRTEHLNLQPSPGTKWRHPHFPNWSSAAAASVK